MTSEYIGIEEARKTLGDLVTAVQQGADIVLTRNGKPAARIVVYKEPALTKITVPDVERAIEANMPNVDGLPQWAADMAREVHIHFEFRPAYRTLDIMIGKDSGTLLRYTYQRDGVPPQERQVILDKFRVPARENAQSENALFWDEWEQAGYEQVDRANLAAALERLSA